ncbi:MAG: CvpA family protein [Planctomycetota bacterium]|jgi:uncharacterized membrane protein required for colicin V production|nr:CvpA family protein [Planctomycetota bacterium]
MESGLIHPLDWLTAACVSFGLVAGIARGFFHQFSRFLVWAGAILAAASLRPTLNHFFKGPEKDLPALPTELAICLVALPGLYLLRKWVFRWLEAISPTPASRIAGGLTGILTSILVVLIFHPLLLWSSFLKTPPEGERQPVAYSVFSVVGSAGAVFPSQFQPRILTRYSNEKVPGGTGN